nr:uncharacterized protein LOC106048954 isoform X2 [Anser cygnoides]
MDGRREQCGLGQHLAHWTLFRFTANGQQAVPAWIALTVRRQLFSQKTFYVTYMQTMRVASSPDYTQELRPVSEVSMLCALTILDGQLEMLRTQLLEQLTLFGTFSNQSQVTQDIHLLTGSLSNCFWIGSLSSYETVLEQDASIHPSTFRNKSGKYTALLLPRGSLFSIDYDWRGIILIISSPLT